LSNIRYLPWKKIIHLKTVLIDTLFDTRWLSIESIIISDEVADKLSIGYWKWTGKQLKNKSEFSSNVEFELGKQGDCKMSCLNPAQLRDTNPKVNLVFYTDTAILTNIKDTLPACTDSFYGKIHLIKFNLKGYRLIFKN
jgi:hypothetical protein